jgi:hypothetical protein
MMNERINTVRYRTVGFLFFYVHHSFCIGFYFVWNGAWRGSVFATTFVPGGDCVLHLELDPSHEDRME